MTKEGPEYIDPNCPTCETRLGPGRTPDEWECPSCDDGSLYLDVPPDTFEKQRTIRNEVANRALRRLRDEEYHG